MDQGGWTQIPALASHVPDPGELLRRQGAAWWTAVSDLAEALTTWISGQRFGDVAEVGVLYVPPLGDLDTRRPLDASIRSLQHPSLGDDFADDRLGEGKDLVGSAADGRFFVAVVGIHGISAGSYDDIVSAPAQDFTVAGQDVRDAMTRQLWGARVLQAGTRFRPDGDDNPTWTFTLLPGEELCDGAAESGTILKSKVRFRLGKPNRGISSARVAPALTLP